MTQISRHDEICPASHGKLYEMVVCLIRQIGSPQVINTRPFAAGQKYVEQFVSLNSAQLAVFKQVVAAGNILVFVESILDHDMSLFDHFLPLVNV